MLTYERKSFAKNIVMHKVYKADQKWTEVNQM